MRVLLKVLVSGAKVGDKFLVTGMFFLTTAQVLPCKEDGLAGYFGIAERVDFIATSSVKSAEVIDRLKS
ncbi:hypothetical protein C5167_036505 [Papaver somniferum]|uniref:Uncharacterized protein n=1 Tax=Papaver somniferum TaxID=3469 RepID=A0A4Y7I7Z7_PAPSO|nr:hypothetical protein C5167_036505 [Papaver somniferum]